MEIIQIQELLGSWNRNRLLYEDEHVVELFKKIKNVVQNAITRFIEQQVDNKDEYFIINESDGEVSTQHHDIICICITNALHMNIGVCIVIHMHMAFYSMYVLLGALAAVVGRALHYPHFIVLHFCESLSDRCSSCSFTPTV